MREQGLSRDALYAAALSEYLQRRRRDALTERINALCQREATTLPPDLAEATRQGLLRQAS